jgi:hypothetical protein
MTDTQLLTLALAIIFPLSMLIYSNSRVTEAKETLRAEMQAMKGEILVMLTRIENKLDHYAEVQATHSERFDKLEGR